MGLLKNIVLIAASILALIVLAFSFNQARKAYWDYRVDQLCEQDEGVKISEMV